MLNVGLTGNIAAGKSTVVRWFAEWGATVIDADELARQAQEPGTETLAAIARRFGREVLAADGTLDREALRGKVMGDDEALASLNAIVHPAVRRQRARLAEAAEARGDCVLVNDIPLLFEVLNPNLFDLVALVDAPVEVRRHRLMVSRGLSSEDADRLIGAQLPAERKRARSDLVIENADSLDLLEQRAWEAWRAIRRQAAVKALGGSRGPLLAVFAHPGDEALLAGGALARYADAGLQVHVVCAGGRGPKPGAAASLAPPFEAAQRALGVRGMTLLDYPSGGLKANEATATEAIAQTIRRTNPAVLITCGADGVNGDPDRVAVHHWTRLALARTAHRGALFYVTPPDGGRAGPSGGSRAAANREIAAELDVRPWRDLKRDAVAPYDSQGLLGWAGDTAGWVALERERYSAEHRPSHRLTDLYATGQES